jgi:hypothetical protein
MKEERTTDHEFKKRLKEVYRRDTQLEKELSVTLPDGSGRFIKATHPNADRRLHGNSHAPPVPVNHSFQ